MSFFIGVKHSDFENPHLDHLKLIYDYNAIDRFLRSPPIGYDSSRVAFML